MAELKFESLHSHTRMSDGAMSHAEVLQAAEELGVGVLAFTDHDALPNDDTVAMLRAYDGPVKWTLGVELSSFVPRAVGGPERGAVHILGLFVDIRNAALAEFCRAAEDSRLERMRAYVGHLQSLGFVVSEEDILRSATSRNIASPHMVKALQLHPENEAVMEQLKAEFIAAAEHDAELKAKYEQTLKDGPNQWPYTLFMGTHAYKPAPVTGARTLMPYEDTVKLIREAGGLAVAAHWYIEPDKMTRDDIEVVIQAGGLDGIELEVENVVNDRDLTQGAQESLVLVEQYHLLRTWGSDSHTWADLEAFVRSPVAEKSVGQMARLVEQAKPNLEWSRL
ncbi:MAG TPA: PHP domain-containing protein [Candidatus Saccharimonadia bacterium]